MADTAEKYKAALGKKDADVRKKEVDKQLLRAGFEIKPTEPSKKPDTKKQSGLESFGPAAEQELKKYSEELKKVRGMKKGGIVCSASKRADGCAVKGKTRGKMV